MGRGGVTRPMEEAGPGLRKKGAGREGWVVAGNDLGLASPEASRSRLTPQPGQWCLFSCPGER